MKSKKYTKKDIIKILYLNAEVYEQNLLDKNIMFIYKNGKTNSMSYIETSFNDYNFLHLTGMKYKKSAIKFFQSCIRKNLQDKDVEMKNEIFTTLKLEVLESAMAINKSAKRIGIYNDDKSNIKIERVIGNMHCWIGFSNLKQNNEKMKYYYPKTLIQDDFRKNVIEENKIIAILSKNKNEKLYNEITYLSKNTTLARLKEENQILEKIDYQNLKSKSLQYQKRIEKEIK